MGIFGVDVSNYQSSFDFRSWDFAFIKASQGNWFKDGRFQQHLNNARANNCLVAAYHYQETSSAQSQVALIKQIVPLDVPVIIDVENGSGSVDITRSLISLLRAEGYDVPFLYMPRWYWQQVGSPNLAGLPTLWASWYPDYVARPREDGIAKVPGSAWSDYGGNKVGVMQFTSTPFDQNYFPGTRDQLAAILGGRSPGGGTGDDMGWDDRLKNVEGYEDTAGNFLTAAERKIDELTKEHAVVGEDRKTTVVQEVVNLPGNFKRVNDRLDTIEDKVDALSTGTGYTLDQIADAVANKLYQRLQS